MPLWAKLTFALCDFSWLLLGLACLGLAAFFGLRSDSLERAAAADRRLRPGRRDAITLAAMACLPLLFGVYECARQAIYQLTADSGIMANVAWNVVHGYGLNTTVLGGRSYLGVHFAFAIAALAPVLTVWNSMSALAFVQGALVGSAPIALYLLARRKTDDAVIPWLVFILALAHPAFQELVGTVVDNSVLAFPFFVWAAYFFETERPWAWIVATALMLSTREQAPFMTAGVGLLVLAAARQKRGRLIGLSIVVASAALWLAEMQVIGSIRSGWTCFDTWGYFNAIGGSPEAIVKTALMRPWVLAAALVSPPAKILPALRILAFAGFLPLLAGPYFLPALITWLPHQLASYGSNYQALRGHYPSFVLGPLLWAALYGLLKLRRALDDAPWRKAATVAWLVAACGFFAAPRFYYAEARVIPIAWRTAAPAALSSIPADAAVWCDPYLLPNLALRRYVKTLPMALPSCSFEEGLFLPDYVLYSTYWTRLVGPEVSGRILGLLRARGYAPVLRAADLVLLKSPTARSGKPASVSLTTSVPG